MCIGIKCRDIAISWLPNHIGLGPGIDGFFVVLMPFIGFNFIDLHFIKN